MSVRARSEILHNAAFRGCRAAFGRPEGLRYERPAVGRSDGLRYERPASGRHDGLRYERPTLILRRGGRGLLFVVAFAAVCQTPQRTVGASPSDWTQWGGPHRNFMSGSTGLVSTWPSGGPRNLWSRPLGEGHSSILAEGGRVYTMYRTAGPAGQRGQEEAVTALDAATGRTIWTFTYAAPTDGVDFSEGAGPHATPLIVGSRLYASSSRRELFALDKTSGKRLWSHDFIKEYGAPRPDRGYSCSPLAFGNTVIVTVGGAGQAVAAFDQQTGALVWKSGASDPSPASPVLIDVDGEQQLVAFGGDRILGLNPSNGQEMWNVPHKTSWGLNISTPVWSPAHHLLFVSAAYNSGSRAIELHQAGGKTVVSEKWFTNRMRVHIGTVIRIGDYLYGSSGDFGPSFVSAVDINTGKVVWQDRSFARAQFVYADGKLIVLDEDGTLGIATVGPDGLKVLARAPVLEHLSWTPPTLSGTTLYLRDCKTIAAFNLGN
jgi:outer membrane protein assembly factor BamB